MSDASKAEWESNFYKIALAAQLLGELPLAEMLETCERADTLGPILDPTAYMRGAKNLPPQKALLRAALGLVKTHREVMANVEPAPIGGGG